VLEQAVDDLALAVVLVKMLSEVVTMFALAVTERAGPRRVGGHDCPNGFERQSSVAAPQRFGDGTADEPSS
jgi:hypothetical protein